MDPSNAELLFERIVGDPDPVKEIRRMIAEKTKENEWLDFKIAGDDQSKNWSKALAGFGSSSGGVLIYGVEAKKNSEGIDCAIKEVLCDAKAIAEDLLRLLPTMTISPLRGVKVEPVLVHGTMGFVVCFIPEGAHKPYRAEQAGKYYIRAGSSFIAPDPNYLRNLLFPAALYRPKLWIELFASSHPLAPQTHFLQFLTKFENIGNVTISNLLLQLNITSPIPISMDVQAHSWERLHDSPFLICEYKRPVHPGLKIPAYQSSGGLLRLDSSDRAVEEHRRTVKLYFRVFALNQPAMHGNVVFEPDELFGGNKKDVELRLLHEP